MKQEGNEDSNHTCALLRIDRQTESYKVFHRTALQTVKQQEMGTPCLTNLLMAKVVWPRPIQLD